MRKEFKVVKRLWSLLDHPRWTLPGIVLLGVLASFAEGIGISLFIPLLQGLGGASPAANSSNSLMDLLGSLFDGVPFQRRFLLISACLFGCLALKVGLSYSNTLLFRWLEADIGCKIRSRIFKQLQTVDCQFLERSQAGRLLNALSVETWRTGEALATLVSSVVILCALSVYVTLLLLISWKLTLVVAVSALAISLMARSVVRRSKSLGEQVTRTNDALFRRMVEGIQGSKVIRAFGKEDYEQQRFDRVSKQVGSLIMRLQYLAGAVPSLYELLIGALLVGILYMGVHHPESIPATLIYIFILYRLQPRIVALESARIHLSSLEAAVEEVASLLDTHDKPYISSGRQPCEKFSHGIRFERVSFRYHGAHKWALQNLTLFIPAGKTTAIVGASGAGKTTLIHLVLRLYEASQGNIYVDGQPLPSLALDQWRRQIGLVGQDAHAFDASVRENIAYGAECPTDEQIIAAARAADAHNFILELPRGYSTRIGDRGVRLSGGQKQRLALARALVRNPSILILDEATNALDGISEAAVRASLYQLHKCRTTIVIAHRLSTIKQADQIIVLKDGMLQELGSFSQLIRRGSLFSNLFAVYPVDARSEIAEVQS
jgi:ATP-binding cassette, subfamily B, bacterial MsbA